MPLALLLVAAVLTTAAVVTLRVAFSGSALAERVTSRLNADLRGSVTIKSIDWPLASTPTVVLGGWVPVVLREVQVRDADGIVVLRSPQVRAEIDVHAVLFGEHDVLARRVVMDGGELVVREVRERAPQFDGDTAVSLVAAFESKQTPSRAGARGVDGARLELRDAELRRTTIVIDALPVDAAATRHALHVSIADVSARGALAYDPRVSPARLVFQATPRGGAGEVVVRGRRVGIAGVDVRELAQADTTITFGGDVTLATGEHVHVEGALRDYWPTGHFGKESRLAVTVTGVRGTIAAAPPVVLDVPPLRLLHDLQTGEGTLEEVAVRAAGGTVRASARWGGGPDGNAPTWLEGTVATTEPLELTPWLTRDERREVGHTVHARVNIRADARTDGLVRLTDPDLRLGRLRIDRGTLVVVDADDVRIEDLHYTMPGLEGTYHCALDPGPPVTGECNGKDTGDTRVLLRLKKLSPW